MNLKLYSEFKEIYCFENIVDLKHIIVPSLWI